MNDLIVIKQLPVIEERLKQIKEDVTTRTEQVLSLVCTEETLQTVKKERASLTKEFTTLVITLPTMIPTAISIALPR